MEIAQTRFNLGVVIASLVLRLSIVTIDLFTFALLVVKFDSPVLRKHNQWTGDNSPFVLGILVAAFTVLTCQICASAVLDRSMNFKDLTLIVRSIGRSIMRIPLAFGVALIINLFADPIGLLSIYFCAFMIVSPSYTVRTSPAPGQAKEYSFKELITQKRAVFPD